MAKLKSCPWCRIGEARSADQAPWHETGYTCCMNPDCVSAGKNGEPQRLPIPLWQALPRYDQEPLCEWCGDRNATKRQGRVPVCEECYDG